MLKELITFATLLLQEKTPPIFPLAERTHAPITVATRLQPRPAASVYKSLIETAVATHIPLGIVFGKNANAEFCSTRSTSLRLPETVGELIDGLKRELPTYTIMLEDGVLNVMPSAMAGENKTEEFLKLVIPHFP